MQCLLKLKMHLPSDTETPLLASSAVKQSTSRRHIYCSVLSSQILHRKQWLFSRGMTENMVNTYHNFAAVKKEWIKAVPTDNWFGVISVVFCLVRIERYRKVDIERSFWVNNDTITKFFICICVWVFAWVYTYTCLPIVINIWKKHTFNSENLV